MTTLLASVIVTKQAQLQGPPVLSRNDTMAQAPMLEKLVVVPVLFHTHVALLDLVVKFVGLARLVKL